MLKNIQRESNIDSAIKYLTELLCPGDKSLEFNLLLLIAEKYCSEEISNAQRYVIEKLRTGNPEELQQKLHIIIN